MSISAASAGLSVSTALAGLPVLEGFERWKSFVVLAIVTLFVGWAIVRYCWHRLRNVNWETLGHAGCTNDRMEQFRPYTAGRHRLIGISCRSCRMEWVLPEFLLPQYEGEEELVAHGLKLHVINRPRNQSPLSMLLREVEIENLMDLSSHLRAGDHIRYRMYVPRDLYHHAIVEDVRRMDGSDIVTLIHWQGGWNSGSRIERNIIYDMRQRAGVIYRCDYREDLIREDDRNLTLARARAWVGESQWYNSTQNNCEHFAFFCKTGLWHSDQGEFGANLILGLTRLIYVSEYQDTAVGTLAGLSPGDHIIMFMTIVHPRCHMIVTNINHASGMIDVVRFTHEEGVVGESITFTRPCKRVIQQETYDPQVVLERANAALRNGMDQPYNIITFNCKHFAFLISRGYRSWRP